MDKPRMIISSMSEASWTWMQPALAAILTILATTLYMRTSSRHGGASSTPQGPDARSSTIASQSAAGLLPTSPSSPPFPFLSLPPELRLQIYGHLVPRNEPCILPFSPFPGVPPPPPGPWHPLRSYIPPYLLLRRPSSSSAPRAPPPAGATEADAGAGPGARPGTTPRRYARAALALLATNTQLRAELTPLVYGRGAFVAALRTAAGVRAFVRWVTRDASAGALAGLADLRVDVAGRVVVEVLPAAAAVGAADDGEAGLVRSRRRARFAGRRVLASSLAGTGPLGGLVWIEDVVERVESVIREVGTEGPRRRELLARILMGVLREEAFEADERRLLEEVCG
ncbi:hypothetical protein MBLNU459_g2362t1 [Dothideomycetes sp. NU459]